MISKLDLILVVVYILSLLVLGWYTGRKNKTQEDYFLAGRSMPWLPIGLSVAATMISANGFVGAPGWAYNDGLSPFMVNIGVPLAIFVVMLTSVPLFYALRLTSVYEYIELRFGPYTRVLAVLGFIANSIIQISSMVFIPSLIIQRLTGWSLVKVVPIVVVSAIVYTLLGGIKAVIWTDALQMVVMWFGVLFSLFFVLGKMEVGFFETVSMAREAGKLNALDFSLDWSRTNAFWATLIGGTVMWIRYFGYDQGQVQRILTAKSLKGVKRSFVVSAVMMNTLYFLFMCLGILLYYFFNGRAFESSNDVVITLITDYLPIGVVGLVLAGVFAAAMSSVDSLLNAMSTVYVKDIHERFFSRSNEAASLKMSMAISAVWGLVVIGVTLLGFSGTTQSVLAVVGSYIAYISGPMCGAFFLGLFTVKAHDRGVTLGIVLGFIATYVIGTQTDISWIWRPAVGMVLTCAIGYGASLLLGNSKTDADVKRYTVMGQRSNLLASGNVSEGGVSLLPLQVDKYAWTVLGFFIAQYLLLYMIAR